MRKTFLPLLAFVIHYSTNFAQYGENIRPDRPGQSLTTFTVGTNIVQLQTGCDLFSTKNRGQHANSSGYFSNTVLRYGLSEKFEINYLFNYQVQSETVNDAKSNQQGVNAMDIGGRYHFMTERGVLPSMALQMSARLPALGSDYKTKHAAPRFSIITHQQLIKALALVTVWGASWNGNNSTPLGNYVINLSYPFYPKLSGFVENYGSIERGILNSKFDGGLAWLLTRDLQLGLYGGYGYNQGVSSCFISSGLSWRSKRKKA